LKSDNGGEYKSNEFNERKFTMPYRPQQNGVLNIKTKKIFGTTLAMLSHVSLFFWLELY
jgi:hypothetical protein